VSPEVATAPHAPTPARVADFIGQATAIEQARAVAEVQAAIVVAQQCPRDLEQAISTMRDSTGQPALAERSTYSYRKGGSTVNGPTIHLARELARCWGNIQYGIAELRRDDGAGFSEMQAYAWDVQTNTRSALIFIVPHRRDKADGTEKLASLRDIYENNTNNGARRVRECIFAVLPPWFVEEARQRCADTLRNGGGKPLAQRVDDCVRSYSQLGVAEADLEGKVGRKRGRWTEQDVAQLGVTFRSIQRGELLKDDEFPQQRVTAAEITGQPAEQPAPEPPNGWPQVPEIKP
jgi:hypothetical protein